MPKALVPGIQMKGRRFGNRSGEMKNSSSAAPGRPSARFTVDCAPGTFGYTTEISFNGGARVPASSILSHTWVTTDFHDGTHIVQVRVNANNGKTGYSQIRAYEVRNAPTATTIVDCKGGTIDNPDGASAVVPKDALLDQVEVTIVPVEPVEQ